MSSIKPTQSVVNFLKKLLEWTSESISATFPWRAPPTVDETDLKVPWAVLFAFQKRQQHEICQLNHSHTASWYFASFAFRQHSKDWCAFANPEEMKTRHHPQRNHNENDLTRTWLGILYAWSVSLKKYPQKFKLCSAKFRKAVRIRQVWSRAEVAVSAGRPTERTSHCVHFAGTRRSVINQLRMLIRLGMYHTPNYISPNPWSSKFREHFGNESKNFRVAFVWLATPLPCPFCSCRCWSLLEQEPAEKHECLFFVHKGENVQPDKGMFG